MCIIDTSMPKKTRPITVLMAEELDALDDATSELAADEECLHQALEAPSTIRSGLPLSIAKTKTRRQTVSRQRTLDQTLAYDSDDQAPNPPGRGTGITSVHDQLPAQGTVVPGDATSVVTTEKTEEQSTRTTRPPRWMKIWPCIPQRLKDGIGIRNYPYLLIPP